MQTFSCSVRKPFSIVLTLSAAAILVACGGSEFVDQRGSGTSTNPQQVVDPGVPLQPVELTCTASETEEGVFLADGSPFFVLNGVDLQSATTQDIKAALSSGVFTSEQLVQRQIKLIEVFDSEVSRAGLNSIRTLAPDALEQARAADQARKDGTLPDTPLAGLTVLLKDNVGTTDMPTTAGSIALAENIPKFEAFITRQLRAAGAIVLGKTNLSEFANWMDLRMPNGYSSLGGQVIAPYDFGADPSGSSTGSGVASTMAFGLVAIGSETSGSIISPATRHSLVGVKPTIGLVSRTGVIPLAHSFDTAGPMARNVTDAAALLQVVAGLDDQDDASPRFVASQLEGVVPDYLSALKTDALTGARIGVRDSDITTAGPFGEALATMEALGAEIVVFDPDSPPLGNSSLGSLTTIFNEFKWYLNKYLVEEAGAGLPAYTLREIIDYNEQFPEKVKYGQSMLQLSDAQSGLEVDPVYLASRTAAIEGSQTYLNSLFADNDLDAIAAPNGGNTGLTAAAGYPNLTVPMGYNGQSPQGLAFAGLPFTEKRLLAYAYAFEQATKLRVPATDLNPGLVIFCEPMGEGQ